MNVTDILGKSRQVERRRLRSRADTVLRGLLGRGLARANRRLVARAYALAAYRLLHSLPTAARHRYARHDDSPVILNQDMIAFVAEVKPPARPTAEQQAYARPQD